MPATDLLAAGQNCAMVLPTGTGKTKAALWTCDRLLTRTGGGEILWLVDSRALIKQTQEAAAAEGVPVRVRTIQGLHAKAKNGERAIEPGAYRAIVVDEAHRFLTELRAGILRSAETPLLGLTATPRRGDGRHISDLLGDGYVGGPYTLGQAIADGWLCDCRVLRVELNELDLSEVKATKHDFDPKALAEVMNVASHNEEVVGRWLEVAKRLDGSIATSNFFAVDCDHADALADEVARHLPGLCRPIHSKCDGADDLVEAFRKGEFPVASSVMMVAEGFDLPKLEVGCLVRPTKSERLLVQMLGRLLRVAPGKLFATLLDFTGAYERLDLASIYDVVEPHAEEETTLTEGDVVPRIEDGIPMLSDVISRVREIDLFRSAVKNARGDLPWQPVGGRYVLPLDAGRKHAAWIVVDRSKYGTGCAAALLRREGSRSVCEVIDRCSPEPEAFARVGEFVRRSYLPQAWAGADLDAARRVETWFRDRAEATESQLAALDRCGIDVARLVKGGYLQRGQAQREIRRLHASGRWVPAMGDS